LKMLCLISYSTFSFSDFCFEPSLLSKEKILIETCWLNLEMNSVYFLRDLKRVFLLVIASLAIVRRSVASLEVFSSSFLLPWRYTNYFSRFYLLSRCNSSPNLEYPKKRLPRSGCGQMICARKVDR
jgi:hypothetical protein